MGRDIPNCTAHTILHCRLDRSMWRNRNDCVGDSISVLILIKGSAGPYVTRRSRATSEEGAAEPMAARQRVMNMFSKSIVDKFDLLGNE